MTPRSALTVAANGEQQINHAAINPTCRGGDVDLRLRSEAAVTFKAFKLRLSLAQKNRPRRKTVDPLDLMARLAALVPPPRMHLTRYHGVFAPHTKLRAAITPAGRGAGGKGAKPDAEAPAVAKHLAMSWAQRLNRVFAIEIDTCARCLGRRRVIASIEEPEVIGRILAHRQRECGAAEPQLAPVAARAPPRLDSLL